MPSLKKEIEVDIDIIVKCYECGEDLNIKSEIVDSWSDVIVSVESCDCQLEEKVDE